MNTQGIIFIFIFAKNIFIYGQCNIFNGACVDLFMYFFFVDHRAQFSAFDFKLSLLLALVIQQNKTKFEMLS